MCWWSSGGRALGSPAGSGPGVVARSSRPSPSRASIMARPPRGHRWAVGSLRRSDGGPSVRRCGPSQTPAPSQATSRSEGYSDGKRRATPRRATRRKRKRVMSVGNTDQAKALTGVSSHRPPWPSWRRSPRSRRMPCTSHSQPGSRSTAVRRRDQFPSASFDDDDLVAGLHLDRQLRVLAEVALPAGRPAFDVPPSATQDPQIGTRCGAASVPVVASQ